MAFGDDAPCVSFLESLYLSPERFLDHYYDNTGKYGPHFMEGLGALWLGDVRGCASNETSRYCVLDLVASYKSKAESKHKVKWGVCVPHFCTLEVMQRDSKRISEAFFHSYTGLTVGDKVSVSCLERLGPTGGYYVVLVLVMLLLAWCLFSTFVIWRYEAGSRMRYGLVYMSGPRSLGLVRPSVRRRFYSETQRALSSSEEEAGGRPEGMLDLWESVREATRVEVEGQSEGVALEGGMTHETPEDERSPLVPHMKIEGRASGSDRNPSTSSATPGDRGGLTSDNRLVGGEETFGPPSEDLLERAFKYRPGFLARTCSHFCIRTNLSTLFDGHRPTGRLTGLDCIRVVSFLLLLLVQVHMFALEFGIIADASLKEKIIRGYSLTYVVACYPLALDAIFLVSGFLSITRKLGRWQKFICFLVRRYLRLFAPLVFILLITVFLLPYWTSWMAPQSFWFEREANLCSEVWWKVVLGMQNFTDSQNMCMGWTWVVAALWQLTFFLSFIFFCTVNKVFIFCHVFLMASAAICIATLIIDLDLQPDIIGNISEWGADSSKGPKQFVGIVLVRPYTYVPAFSVGVLLSYLLQRRKHPRGDNEGDSAINIGCLTKFKALAVRLCYKKACPWLGWIACLVVLVGFFCLQLTNMSDGWPKSAVKAFSGTAFHLLWPLVLACIMYNCCHGRGGILQWISEWGAWMQIWRLTYCAYLVHGLCLSYICSAWTSTVIPGNGYSLFIVYSSTLVLSYAASIVVHLLIEAPLLSLLARPTMTEKRKVQDGR